MTCGANALGCSLGVFKKQNVMRRRYDNGRGKNRR